MKESEQLKHNYSPGTQCSEIGCANVVACRGYCHKCYMKKWHSGELSLIPESEMITKHSLYVTWKCIIQRCTNANATGYKNYGGRGIQVCDRWRNPVLFCKDIIDSLGEKPSDSHTLDRKNTDGHYEISNMRWATKSEQALNQRLRVSSSKSKTQYAGITTYHNKFKSTYSGKYLGLFSTIEQAISARINHINNLKNKSCT